MQKESGEVWERKKNTEKRVKRGEKVEQTERLLEKHPEIDFDAFMKARVVFYDRQTTPSSSHRAPSPTSPLSTSLSA